MNKEQKFGWVRLGVKQQKCLNKHSDAIGGLVEAIAIVTTVPSVSERSGAVSRIAFTSLTSCCHSCCSQVCTLFTRSAATSQFREDMEWNHSSDVNEAKKHDCSWSELPTWSVLCKECKLVSLVLCVALLIRQPASFVWCFSPCKGTLASSILLWLVHCSVWRYRILCFSL